MDIEAIISRSAEQNIEHENVVNNEDDTRRLGGYVTDEFHISLGRLWRHNSKNSKQGKSGV